MPPVRLGFEDEEKTMWLLRKNDESVGKDEEGGWRKSIEGGFGMVFEDWGWGLK